MKENNLLNLIRLKRIESILFRINAGTAWTGTNVEHIGYHKMVPVEPGDVVIHQARPFHGAITGWSDLAGWTPTIVTPDMVGKSIAIFTAIEAKTKNVRITRDQANFLRQVETAGGIAEVVHESDFADESNENKDDDDCIK